MSVSLGSSFPPSSFHENQVYSRRRRPPAYYRRQFKRQTRFMRNSSDVQAETNYSVATHSKDAVEASIEEQEATQADGTDANAIEPTLPSQDNLPNQVKSFSKSRIVNHELPTNGDMILFENASTNNLESLPLSSCQKTQTPRQCCFHIHRSGTPQPDGKCCHHRCRPNWTRAQLQPHCRSSRLTKS